MTAFECYKLCIHKWLLSNTFVAAATIFSERTTLRSLYAISRPSVVCLLSVVCLSVVCDVLSWPCKIQIDSTARLIKHDAIGI